jgi:hypothetical protein
MIPAQLPVRCSLGATDWRDRTDNPIEDFADAGKAINRWSYKVLSNDANDSQ